MIYCLCPFISVMLIFNILHIAFSFASVSPPFTYQPPVCFQTTTHAANLGWPQPRSLLQQRDGFHSTVPASFFFMLSLKTNTAHLVLKGHKYPHRAFPHRPPSDQPSHAERRGPGHPFWLGIATSQCSLGCGHDPLRGSHWLHRHHPYRRPRSRCGRQRRPREEIPGGDIVSALAA